MTRPARPAAAIAGLPAAALHRLRRVGRFFLYFFLYLFLFLFLAACVAWEDSE